MATRRPGRRSTRRPSPLGTYNRHLRTPNPDYVPPMPKSDLEADADAEFAFQQAVDAARILGFPEDEPVAHLDRHGRELDLPVVAAPKPAPGTGDPRVSALVASLKESVNRDRKARAIAAIWVGCDADTATVRTATNEQWALASQAAGYDELSSDGLLPSAKTRQRVLELLALGDRLARAATGMAVRVVKGGK